MLGKSLFPILMLALSTVFVESAGAGGFGAGNGGDATWVTAQEYPSEKLEAGVQEALDSIRDSELPDALKLGASAELQALSGERKFLMLPAMIILAPGTVNPAYAPEQGGKRFVSLGGMTENEIGAPVYLAERTLTYSPKMLGKVLIHEVLHHVLSKALSADEAFVYRLSEELIQGPFSLQIRFALEHGAYIHKGMIARDQFIDAMDFEKLVREGFKFQYKSGDAYPYGWTREVFLRQVEYYKNQLRERLPENLWNFSVATLGFAIQNTFSDGVSFNIYGRSYDKIYSLSRQLDPKNPWTTRDFGFAYWTTAYYCKSSNYSFLPFCSDDEQLWMKDLFSSN